MGLLQQMFGDGPGGRRLGTGEKRFAHQRIAQRINLLALRRGHSGHAQVQLRLSGRSTATLAVRTPLA